MSFKMEEISKHTFMKNDEPQVGYLFIVHRGRNNHQTPYLIFHDGNNMYKLMNLQSYQANYCGETIKELIENYLTSNNDGGLNPITDYFFSRRWHSEIQIEDTFGWKETGFKRKSKDILERINEVTTSKEAGEILDKAIDKYNE